MIKSQLLGLAMLVTTASLAQDQTPVVWLQAYGGGSWSLYSKGANADGVDLRPGAGLLITGKRYLFSACWERYENNFTYRQIAQGVESPMSIRTSGNAFPVLIGAALNGTNGPGWWLAAGPVLYFNDKLEGDAGQGWKPYTAEQRTGLAVCAMVQWDHRITDRLRLDARFFMDLQALQTFNGAPMHYPPANFLSDIPGSGPTFGLTAGLAFGLPRP